MLLVYNIDWLAERERNADLTPEGLADLRDLIERRGLDHPIAVRRMGLRARLIAGRRRLGDQLAKERLGNEIPAAVYPEDLPAVWMKIIEIEENLQREDLTYEEKTAHAISLAAALKDIEQEQSLSGTDFTGQTEDKPKPTTGRGHKGITQKVAETVGIDQSGVRKRVKKAAETIGEPIDLEADSSAELARKASEVRARSEAWAAERAAQRKTARTSETPKLEPKLTPSEAASPWAADIRATHQAFWSWLVTAPSYARVATSIVDCVGREGAQKIAEAILDEVGLSLRPPDMSP